MHSCSSYLETKYCFNLLWEIRVSLNLKATTRATVLICTNVRSILCIQTMVGLLGLLMCAQMLMHMIVHGGCMNTIRVDTESWLTRNIPFRIGESNLWQHCAWIFGLTFYQLSCATPAIDLYDHMGLFIVLSQRH